MADKHGFPFLSYSSYRFPADIIHRAARMYKEDIVDGLANAPEAFIGMLEARNSANWSSG